MIEKEFGILKRITGNTEVANVIGATVGTLSCYNKESLQDNNEAQKNPDQATLSYLEYYFSKISQQYCISKCTTKL